MKGKKKPIKLPKLISLPYIAGVYIIVVMGLSSLSVVFAVMVGYIHHQSLMDREVPDWLRRLGRRLNRFVLVHPRRKPGSVKDPSTTETTPDPKHSFNGSFTSLNLTFKNDVEIDNTPNHKPKVLSQTYVQRDGTLKLANSNKVGLKFAPGSGIRLNHNPGVNTPLLNASVQGNSSGSNTKEYNEHNSTNVRNPEGNNGNFNTKSSKDKGYHKSMVQNSSKLVKYKDVAQGETKSNHTKDIIQNNPKGNHKEFGHHSQKASVSKEPIHNSPKSHQNKTIKKDKSKIGGDGKHETIPLQTRECQECKLFKQAKVEALQGCQASPNPQPHQGSHPGETCHERSHSKECNRTKKRCERHYNQQEEILKRLSLLLLKQEEMMKPQPDEVNKEWHEIAEVIDRCFFWFYLTITTVTTILILLLIPLGKSVNMDT